MRWVGLDLVGVDVIFCLVFFSLASIRITSLGSEWYGANVNKRLDLLKEAVEGGVIGAGCRSFEPYSFFFFFFFVTFGNQLHSSH